MLPLNVGYLQFSLQLFSVRLKVAQGQERERVKELSYDYVSDEEDSTDGKWVVGMGNKKVFLEVSRSRPHIIILYIRNPLLYEYCGNID